MTISRSTLIRVAGIVLTCLSFALASLVLGRVHPAAKIPALIAAVVFLGIAAVVICVFAVTDLIQRNRR
jgi:hypothetical protein